MTRIVCACSVHCSECLKSSKIFASAGNYKQWGALIPYISGVCLYVLEPHKLLLNIEIIKNEWL